MSKNKLSIGLAACLLVFGLSGCTRSALLVANHMAKSDSYRLISGLPYGNAEENRLDLYIPRNISQQDPTRIATVIFFYGGCWGACNSLTKEHYRFVGQALAEQGFLVAIPDYRQYPEVLFGEILVDGNQVTEWVSEHIQAYGGNPSHLFLMGHSAGAHIAATLTMDESQLRPATRARVKGLIGLAGPYDFLPFTETYQRILFSPEENYSASQPINFVDGTEAPSLLLWGKEDRTVQVRNIKNFAEKISRLGGRAETRYYEDLGHVGIIAELSVTFRASNRVTSDISQFVQNTIAEQAAHGDKTHAWDHH